MIEANSPDLEDFGRVGDAELADQDQAVASDDVELDGEGSVQALGMGHNPTDHWNMGLGLSVARAGTACRTKASLYL